MHKSVFASIYELQSSVVDEKIDKSNAGIIYSMYYQYLEQAKLQSPLRYLPEKDSKNLSFDQRKVKIISFINNFDDLK